MKSPRTLTVKDSEELRKQIERMAKKWEWTVPDFEQYLLRMGANRVMSLERQSIRKGRST